MAEIKFPALSVGKKVLDLDIPQFSWKKSRINKKSVAVLLAVYYGKYNGRDIVAKRLRSGE